MIPSELPSREIDLPDAESSEIVIFTGASLRHDRFALRLQQEFGEDVVRWYRVKTSSVTTSLWKRAKDYYDGLIKKKEVADNRGIDITARRVADMAKTKGRKIWERIKHEAINTSRSKIEEELFGQEIRELRNNAHLKPKTIKNPNAPAVVKKVQGIAPYFIVTLGGAIYGKEIRNAAAGLALNQHDGWCPDYKGTATVWWTLYKRDLRKIGNTIHLLTSGMDAGPILRRSAACITKYDTPRSIFARSVALGTELMCEVIHEAKESDTITVFDQPAGYGRTYLNKETTIEIKRSVDRDFRKGWLEFELDRIRSF